MKEPKLREDPIICYEENDGTVSLTRNDFLLEYDEAQTIIKMIKQFYEKNKDKIDEINDFINAEKDRYWQEMNEEIEGKYPRKRKNG